MHSMAVMAMVMVHLRDCDLRGQGRENSQGKGKTSHWWKQCLTGVMKAQAWFVSRSLDLSLPDTVMNLNISFYCYCRSTFTLMIAPGAGTYSRRTP